MFNNSPKYKIRYRMYGDGVLHTYEVVEKLWLCFYIGIRSFYTEVEAEAYLEKITKPHKL